MNPLPQFNPDFPPMTAAELARPLGITRQAVHNRLRYCPSTGKRAIFGNLADVWHPAALPADLCANLEAAAKAGGFCSVGEMARSNAGAHKPPVPISEITPQCLDNANRLMRALLPSLRRRFVISRCDFERDGAADFERVFGRKISTRHFRALLQRTIDRDSGQENWERLELYLPQKPERKTADPQPPPHFPRLAEAIAEGESGTALWRRIVQTFYEVVAGGAARKSAARQLRHFIWERVPCLAPSREALLKSFNRRVMRWKAGTPFDKRSTSDAMGADLGELAKQLTALGWFIPAAKFFYLLTNRTHCAGSVPEAVLQTISLPALPTGWPNALRRELLAVLDLPEVPACPPEVREQILQRQKQYRKLVPASIAREIAVNPSLVKFHRNPRQWSLDNLCAPGSQRRWTNAAGERVIMQPGDWFGGDDATPGIGVCVPCNEVITPCSERYGVLLGRFQWLAFHDCRTDKLLGWDYVVRPRGSYRAEDILCGMGAVTRTHGVPRQGWQFEGGTWNSNLVRQCIELLQCSHWRTYSPHQKAIESVFNRVWTRLALQFPHADMGRFRNENEANCRLYEACKRGQRDPRRFFPPLSVVVRVFEEEVARHNAKPIDSKQYGRWVPDEFFARATAAAPLRPFSAPMAFIFSPFSAERTVRGMLVRCRVPMFENFSVPFEFGADWLPKYHGKKVRLHFNPREPQCVATAILQEAACGKRPGEVLGEAPLVSETARQIRYILEWGDDDQRAGYVQHQRAANFVRRETRGIGAGGRVEYSKSENRDGFGHIGIVERDKHPIAPAEDTRTRSQQRLTQNLGRQEPPESDSRLARRQAEQAELAELRKQTDHLFT
jgi:hypothetical protein